MISVELKFLLGITVVGKWWSWVAVSVESDLLILVAVFGKWGWFVVTVWSGVTGTGEGVWSAGNETRGGAMRNSSEGIMDAVEKWG